MVFKPNEKRVIPAIIVLTFNIFLFLLLVLDVLVV